MTVDPHQVHNLVTPTLDVWRGNESATVPDSDEILPLLLKLSRLLARLGNCVGSECYDLDGKISEWRVEQNYTADANRALSVESMQSSIRNRIPCHNPPNWTTDPWNDSSIQRNTFVHNWPVPEPFTYGFPFSDGDAVGEDLLQTWAAYEHYFH